MRDKVRALNASGPEQVELSTGHQAHFDAARGEVVITSGVVARMRIPANDVLRLAALLPADGSPEEPPLQL